MKHHMYAQSNQIGEQAAQAIRDWLDAQPQTLGVISVEADKRYQCRDIDFLWETEKNIYRVEVKGDTKAHQTGNFFLETQSNVERGTTGCFMYTEADLLFYYLLATQELYILPVGLTRHWFSERINRFKERQITNALSHGRHYTTRGRLVPIEQVMSEVPHTIKCKVLKRRKQ